MLFFIVFFGNIKSYAKDILITTLFVGKVKLGMSKSEVTKLLGKPTDICEEECVVAGIYNFGLFYKIHNHTMVVLFYNEQVSGIEIDSRRYVTKSGVKVGDSLKKLINVYGAKLMKLSGVPGWGDFEGSVSYYYVKGETGVVAFYFGADNKVLSIAVYTKSTMPVLSSDGYLQ